MRRANSATRARIWRYAQALVAKFPAPTFLRNAVMGRGHVARTAVDCQHMLEELLPTVKITVEGRLDTEQYDHPNDYRVTHFIPTVIYEQYQTSLLAAGIDMKTQTIVDRRAWSRAAVVLRLTGKPLMGDVDAMAEEVSARRERRLAREEARLLRHRLELEP